MKKTMEKKQTKTMAHANKKGAGNKTGLAKQYKGNNATTVKTAMNKWM